MERLTERNKDVVIMKNPKLANERLADFEDFMEEQGFESLEELDNYIQTIHSHYDEIKNKGTCGFCEHLDNKENQALKDRWQKLKEWITSFEDFLEQAKIENAKITGVYMNVKVISTESLKLKMQELEKE